MKYAFYNHILHTLIAKQCIFVLRFLLNNLNNSILLWLYIEYKKKIETRIIRLLHWSNMTIYGDYGKHIFSIWSESGRIWSEISSKRLLCHLGCNCLYLERLQETCNYWDTYSALFLIMNRRKRIHYNRDRSWWLITTGYEPVVLWMTVL